jgi:tetratricopeptide (TPR) repeat protein
VLIGRSREIDGLEGLLAGAVSGSGGLRILHGEAGIGKTRLANEIATRASTRGFIVAWGRAWETEGAPAYWPWIELLGALVALDPNEEVSPRVRALLNRNATVPLGDSTRADPARERFELFDAVSSFLRASTRTAPLLLILDDLHMADIASLELLSFVARGLRTSRIAVVGTYRDAESRLPPVADVLGRIAREGDAFPLRRLSVDEVGELVRQDRGHLDRALAAALFELTEGNPLFVHETLDTIAGSAHDAPIELLRSVPVGGGVLALVRDRLARTGSDTRQLIEIASVVGREVWLPLFAEICERPLAEVRQHLDSATALGLLTARPAERWVFSHVLVREAFYRELTAERRAAIHARISEVLRRRVRTGDEEHLATLAHHAIAALPEGDAIDAIRTARLAASRARAQLAYEEAVSLLERARTACESFPVDTRERAEVELALGWALTEAGQLSRGREVFRRATNLARSVGDPRLLARAALGQGGEYVLAEIRGELIELLREGLAAIGDAAEIEDRRLRARLLSRLAAALMPSATPEEPIALAREALVMVAAETDARARIDVDVAVGSALADFAHPRERIPVNERLLRDARSVGDRALRLRALTRLSCDRLEIGDVAAADAAIAARSALAESIGHPRYLWQTPLLRSMRAMPDGRFDDCEAEITEARRLAAEATDANAERCIELHRFSMLVVAGRLEELRAQEVATLGAVDPLPDAATLRAWIMAITASRLGNRARALHSLRSLGHASYMTARMSRASIAEAAVLCGATEFYERLYPTFDADDDGNASWGPFAFSSTPPMVRVLGLVAFAMQRTEEGERHCTRALALTDRMDARGHRAWVLLALGEGLGAVSGREHLDAARDLGAKLRMPEIVSRASALLGQAARRSSGPKPAPSRPPFTLAREGTEWVIEHAGLAFRLRDMRGLAMLASLVEVPGREIYALDLASSPSGDPSAAIDLGDAGECIDARAREAYKRRIFDLRSEVEEAERIADAGRAARLRDELDALTEQVAAAVGLGGRERRVGSAAERARITVQRRLREAIKKIASQDAELGRHLDWTVRTGTFCAYEPGGRKGAR